MHNNVIKIIKRLIDGLHLFWFRKLASARASKSGRQKTVQTFESSQTQLQQRPQFGGESEYYLDLENEDKKWYTEKSTLSKGELLPDSNISVSLLLICL